MPTKNETFEHRSTSEVRASSEGGQLRLSGYAALYNKRSCALADRARRKFFEIIQPGAFDGILKKNPDCRLTINHDPLHTVARTTAKTLMLASDSRGLKFNAILPDTGEAKDLHTNVAAGNLNECSFVFANPTCSYSDTMDEEGNPCTLRTILNFDKGELKDVSVVPTGAYSGTSVAARAKRDDASDEDAAEDEYYLYSPAYDPAQQNERHSDDGDCAVECCCQNRSLIKRSKTNSFHDTLLRGKRCGDADLLENQFAVIGDPDNTRTWRLPLHNVAAIQRSLARFDQVATGAMRMKACERMLAALRTQSEFSTDRGKRAAIVGAEVIKDLQQELVAGRKHRTRTFLEAL